MRKKIAAANWKMNGTSKEVIAFAQTINQITTEHEIIFAPPTIYLTTAQAHKSDTLSLAAQTANEHENGAFTGETSMTMLNDCECRYVIIGHSERRAHYHEEDAMLFAKVKTAFAHGITPILCIGETDAENKKGLTEEVLHKQLGLAIQNLNQTEKQKIVIAYEPIWAIGSGITPSLDDIQSIHKKIRYLFSKNDDTIAPAVRILYGGSVKPDNAKDIFSCPDVDGGLIGGASLTIESFSKIIKAL